jgi:methylated-DNA-[protein]-cysteine S-methyltransferase
MADPGDACRGALDTPLGRFYVEVRDGAVTGAGWGNRRQHPGDPLLAEALAQLAAYFDGRLTRFDLPLAPPVAPPLRAFLDALVAIPYGETRTYGQMARALGITAQAAGQACGRNPIGVIVPCHRVTGSSDLGGFSAPGGVETKVALLKLEGAASLLL